ncbi:MULTISPECIES: 6-bladed beta-propeller [Dysgonomonadaceae]|uniref:6-bladed beta-propeller n=1 Tax=Dysgonomonadaceae TaxID=2005520 RepID=UPI001EECCC78|nr:6-bladed beta-propeller [Proteiniphilum propionicum]ULB33758.1 6-bladed beta-propeller [Proteiniphilum propionicum]
MKNKTTVAFVCFMLLFSYSCQKRQQESSLISGFNRNAIEVESLDDLFGKRGKQIALETTDEALVGKVGKIIKRKDCYFILSGENKILQFDNNGRFVSTLNKLGAGPDEYTMITDFACLINENNEIEIWISDFKKIRKYRKAVDSWEQFASIDYPYVINKIHIINDSHILLLTGQNDNCLTISNGKGEKISSYLKSEIPFMVFKPVQFVDFGQEIIFQQGVSNQCVIYSPFDNSFTERRIINEKRFLSSKMLQDLFSKYEYDYLKELPGYSYIRTLRKVKGQILIDFFMDKKRHVSFHADNVWRTFTYDPKDITENDDLECLSTIGVGDGLTSFIMFKNNENEDENPIVVEY